MTLSYVERRDLNVRTVSSESRLGARQRRVVRRPSLRLQQAVDCASIALDRSMISGNIGKVVAGQAGYIRSTFANQQLRIAMRCDAMRFDSQVEQPDIVSSYVNDDGDRVQAERFESQEKARVHQATGMYGVRLRSIPLRQGRRARDAARPGSCANLWYGPTA
jgi:hypothetical protein